MRILYVLDDTLDKPDGVQQCVIAIAEYMREIGHEVHYLVAKTQRTDLPNIHPIAKYVELKFNGNSVRTPMPTSSRRIKKILNIIKPQVIHIQMPFSPFFGSKVISLADKNTQIVGTWHTFPTGGLQKLAHYPLRWMIGHTLLRVDQTIGVSIPTANFADKIYKTDSIVIPNAVDIKRFQVTSSKSKKKRLVFLGRFDERKGPLHLIEALRRLSSTGYNMHNVEIVMGGKGPDLDKCKNISHDYGLDINFCGFVPEIDKPKFLADADISVFPSTGGEAFGISVVEAMASGSSIVLAGDNAGYRSILGDKPELLFDPTDTSAFANKLKQFLELDSTSVEKYRRWVKDASEQYDVQQVCTQLFKIYTKN